MAQYCTWRDQIFANREKYNNPTLIDEIFIKPEFMQLILLWLPFGSDKIDNEYDEVKVQRCLEVMKSMKPEICDLIRRKGVDG